MIQQSISTIHQIFFQFGDKELAEIPRFAKQVQKTKEMCHKFNYEYKMWNLEEIENFIKSEFSEYYELFMNFRYPVQKVDFARYCILYTFGGVYLDCDVSFNRQIDEFFNYEIFFAKWANDKRQLPYIAVIGSLQPQANIFLKILTESKKSYYEKINIKIYDTWKCRFVFHTTGHYVVNRVIRQLKLDKEKILIDCLYIHHRISKNKWEYIGNKESPFFDINDSDWMD